MATEDIAVICHAVLTAAIGATSKRERAMDESTNILSVGVPGSDLFDSPLFVDSTWAGINLGIGAAEQGFANDPLLAGFYTDLLATIAPGYVETRGMLETGLAAGGFDGLDQVLGAQLSGVLGPLDMIGLF
jgi:hypothetical protein